MIYRRRDVPPLRRVLAPLAFAVGAVFASASDAQVPGPVAPTITSDGTLSTRVVVSNENRVYAIDNGTQRGNNLFHSFGDFSVPSGGSAIFNGPATTTNVFSRVTGGAPSTIDGVISTRAGASPMPNANFFLINPAGVMFGANSSVDVGGSFHVSTADHIRLADGVLFSAVPGAGDGLLSSAAPAAFGFLGSNPAITSDGTLGTQVEGLGTDYFITEGTRKGNNLFHSFGLFSVPNGSFALFEGPSVDPDGVKNVISRVTGGQVSNIDGFISTRFFVSTPMPNASFFLINPAGIMFGPGANIDVGGAFHASTATNLGLSDGTVFSAMPGPGDALLASALDSAQPQAFGFLNTFLGRSPWSIDVNGAALLVDPGLLFFIDPLLVDPTLPGQTLSLIGGDVTLRAGAVLLAPGGLVRIVSVGSPGIVNLAALDLGLGSFASLGRVNISEGSGISAGGLVFDAQLIGGLIGGSVVIRAGQLTIEGGATVTTDTFESGGAVVGIDLGARESILVREGAKVSTISIGSSDASPIAISGGNLVVTDVGTTIETQGSSFGGASGAIDIQVANADILAGARIQTTSRFDGAKISVNASGTLTVAGSGSEIFTSTTSDSNQMFGGDIAVTAGSLVLRNGGSIRSGANDQQAGKLISITAGAVSIDSLAGISSRSIQGAAGAIEISTPRLDMNAGFINTSTRGAGSAGQMLVNADVVSLTNGAQIASSSQIVASGDGGAITINAPVSVMIDGIGAGGGVGGITLTNSARSGVFSGADSTAAEPGDAGRISVLTPSLTVSGGGTISVATKAGGNAGSILVAGGNFIVSGGGRVDSSTTGAGAGGAITADVSNLSISGVDSGLFSTASSTGDAGQILVSAGNVVLTGGATIDSSTTGAGAGGAINVSASSQVNISDGSRIKADSSAGGFTGNITVSAGDRIVMNGGSISTLAETSDGGNITLLAPNVIRLANSQITTSVKSGTGGGGNIFIDPEFVLLEGSSITANAFGGPGGNITIIANAFVADAASIVEASSAKSTPGTVDKPENNVAGDIAQLPSAPIDASRLMQGACSARRAGTPSSFQVAGRGGVPADPDGYLPAFGASGGAKLVGAPYAPRASLTPGFTLAMAGWDCWR